MVKPLLLVPAVLLIGYCCAPSGSPVLQAVGAQNSGKTANSDTPAHIRKLYQMDCEVCHGATGDGKTDLARDMNLTLLDWTDPKSLSDKTDQQLFDAIRKGTDKMPPEDPARAKNDEVHGLVVYIRSLSKGTPATPAPAPAPASQASAPSSN